MWLRLWRQLLDWRLLRRLGWYHSLSRKPTLFLVGSVLAEKPLRLFGIVRVASVQHLDFGALVYREIAAHLCLDCLLCVNEATDKQCLLLCNFEVLSLELSLVIHISLEADDGSWLEI